MQSITKNFSTFFSFTLGRSIDFRYRSNTFVAISSITFAVINCIYFFTQHNIFLASIWYGLLAGITIFLAWALGREIDPDNTKTANLALIFTGLFFYFPHFQIPKITLLFTLLLVTRLINNTTGKKPTITDTGVILFLIVTQASEFLFVMQNWFVNILQLWGVTILFFSTILTIIFFTQPKITSKDDQGKLQISQRKVQIASLLLLLFATGKSTASGIQGFSHLYPLWMSFGALSAVKLSRKFGKTK